MKLFEVILRFLAVVFSSLAFIVMSASAETRVGAGSTFRMTFRQFNAYSFFVAANFITFIYSCLQFLVTACSMTCPLPNCTRPCGFISDQVLSICMFAASCSAATTSNLCHHGVLNIWPPACTTWNLIGFCEKADAAIVLSFISSFMVISSAALSGYYLNRPY